jgi:hypothetical protein
VTGESNFENFGGAFGVVSARSPDFGEFSNGELVVAGTFLAHVGWYGDLDVRYQPQPLFGQGKLRNDGLIVARDGTVIVTLLQYHPDTGVLTAFITRYR